MPLYSSPVLFLCARSFRSCKLCFHGHNPCQNIVICCLIGDWTKKNSFQFLIFGTHRTKLKHSTPNIYLLHIGIFLSLTVKLFFSKISNQYECGSELFCPIYFPSIIFASFRKVSYHVKGVDHVIIFNPLSTRTRIAFRIFFSSFKLIVR